MIRIKVLTRKDWNSFSSSLQELESIAEYPYGSDYFRINHGTSYFSFFERLGEPRFHIALEGERIVACAAGVLRNIPSPPKPVKAWYLCDLKVHPDYRNQKIPARLFSKNLFWTYLRCSRAYAISMNPPKAPNRVVKIMNQFPFLSFSPVEELNIYNLDFAQTNFITPNLRQVLGPISFLSLEGKKDLLMKSTGTSMKLLHFQYGPFAEKCMSHPQEGFTHMLCASKSSLLNQILQKNFSPAANATVLAHKLNDIDWSFILTSDI